MQLPEHLHDPRKEERNEMVELIEKPQPKSGRLGAKVLSFPDVIAQSVGFMGPVFTSAFVIPLVVGVASVTGKGGGIASPLSVLIAGIGVFAIGWIVSSYAKEVRTAGSLYEYVTRGLGERIGTAAGWLYYAGVTMLTAALLLILGGYLQSTIASEFSVNGGAEWRPAGRPERVNVHDFPSDAIDKAIPYGIYDLGANAGWVSVGTDHDTSAFAVAMLRRWWRADGSARYPAARRLLICADSGGSNAARARAWKVELARLAAETGLEVTVCHYPPAPVGGGCMEPAMPVVCLSIPRAREDMAGVPALPFPVLVNPAPRALCLRVWGAVRASTWLSARSTVTGRRARTYGGQRRRDKPN